MGEWGHGVLFDFPSFMMALERVVTVAVVVAMASKDETRLERVEELQRKRRVHN